MMRLLDSPWSFPVWFCFVAVAWSVLQGMTGYQYGLYIFDRASLDFMRKDKDDLRPSPLRPAVNEHARAWAYGAHHAATYFLCTLAGFGAWASASHLAHVVESWSSADGGTVALLVALSGFAVAGVSGSLPRIMYLGGRPV